MANVLVEVQGPGGRARVAEKDVKSYLRRTGYSIVNTPKEPKHAAKEPETTEEEVVVEDAIEEAETVEENTVVTCSGTEEVTTEDEEEGFKALLEEVKTMNTPELEMVVDEYDLGISLSRERLVADRRVAVTAALKAKKAKG